MKKLQSIILLSTILLSSLAQAVDKESRIEQLKKEKLVMVAKVASIGEIYEEARMTALKSSGLALGSFMLLLAGKALVGLSTMGTPSKGIITQLLISQNHIYYYLEPLTAILYSFGFTTYNGGVILFQKVESGVVVYEDDKPIHELSEKEAEDLAVSLEEKLKELEQANNDYPLENNIFLDMVTFGHYEAQVIKGKLEALKAVLTAQEVLLSLYKAK